MTQCHARCLPGSARACRRQPTPTHVRLSRRFPRRYDHVAGWATFSRPFDPEHVHVVDGPGDLERSTVRKEVLDVRSGMHLGYVVIDKYVQSPGPA